MSNESFNKTLLLVDDEVDLLEALHGCFQRKFPKLTVLSAKSGNEALQMIKQNKVDLVLSDMRMPDGTGMDLLAGIKNLGLKIKTFICTGFSDTKDSDIFELGALSVLKKPLQFSALVREIEKFEKLA